jgi:hypothetical protein
MVSDKGACLPLKYKLFLFNPSSICRSLIIVDRYEINYRLVTGKDQDGDGRT